jgi:hypothetical protein
LTRTPSLVFTDISTDSGLFPREVCLSSHVFATCVPCCPALNIQTVILELPAYRNHSKILKSEFKTIFSLNVVSTYFNFLIAKIKTTQSYIVVFIIIIIVLNLQQGSNNETFSKKKI